MKIRFIFITTLIFIFIISNISTASFIDTSALDKVLDQLKQKLKQATDIKKIIKDKLEDLIVNVKGKTETEARKQIDRLLKKRLGITGQDALECYNSLKKGFSIEALIKGSYPPVLEKAIKDKFPQVANALQQIRNLYKKLDELQAKFEQVASKLSEINKVFSGNAMDVINKAFDATESFAKPIDFLLKDKTLRKAVKKVKKLFDKLKKSKFGKFIKKALKIAVKAAKTIATGGAGTVFVEQTMQQELKKQVKKEVKKKLIDKIKKIVSQKISEALSKVKFNF